MPRQTKTKTQIKKKCPKGKVLNSKTNRCVKKQCPPGKVLNATTGRCVKSKKPSVKKPEKKILVRNLI